MQCLTNITPLYFNPSCANLSSHIYINSFLVNSFHISFVETLITIYISVSVFILRENTFTDIKDMTMQRQSDGKRMRGSTLNRADVYIVVAVSVAVSIAVVVLYRRLQDSCFLFRCSFISSNASSTFRNHTRSRPFVQKPQTSV